MRKCSISLLPPPPNLLNSSSKFPGIFIICTSRGADRRRMLVGGPVPGRAPLNRRSTETGIVASRRRYPEWNTSIDNHKWTKRQVCRKAATQSYGPNPAWQPARQPGRRSTGNPRCVSPEAQMPNALRATGEAGSLNRPQGKWAQTDRAIRCAGVRKSRKCASRLPKEVRCKVAIRNRPETVRLPESLART